MAIGDIAQSILQRHRAKVDSEDAAMRNRSVLDRLRAPTVGDAGMNFNASNPTQLFSQGMGNFLKSMDAPNVRQNQARQDGIAMEKMLYNRDQTAQNRATAAQHWDAGKGMRDANLAGVQMGNEQTRIGMRDAAGKKIQNQLMQEYITGSQGRVSQADARQYVQAHMPEEFKDMALSAGGFQGAFDQFSGNDAESTIRADNDARAAEKSKQEHLAAVDRSRQAIYDTHSVDPVTASTYSPDNASGTLGDAENTFAKQFVQEGKDLKGSFNANEVTKIAKTIKNKWRTANGSTPMPAAFLKTVLGGITENYQLDENWFGEDPELKLNSSNVNQLFNEEMVRYNNYQTMMSNEGIAAELRGLDESVDTHNKSVDDALTRRTESRGQQNVARNTGKSTGYLDEGFLADHIAKTTKLNTATDKKLSGISSVKSKATAEKKAADKKAEEDRLRKEAEYEKVIKGGYGPSRAGAGNLPEYMIRR